MLTFSYIVYIGIQGFYLALAYWMFPETRGMTAEEASVVFDKARNPPIAIEEEVHGAFDPQKSVGAKSSDQWIEDGIIDGMGKSRSPESLQ